MRCLLFGVFCLMGVDCCSLLLFVRLVDRWLLFVGCGVVCCALFVDYASCVLFIVTA